MVRVLSFRSLRAFAITALVAIAATILVASSPRTAGADTYPGLADIAAAKAAVADAQASVAQLDAAIVGLENAAQAAQDEALAAADRYSGAKSTADLTQRESVAATKSAAEATVKLEAARADLAGVAQQAYQDGGTMTSIEAVVGASDFQDVIARTEDNELAATQLDAVTQKVKAAQLYADTMSDFAKKAADAAAVAADEAATALVAAQDSQRTAEQAVADATATREAATVRLASLQNTTVALEKARQQGLANERAQQQRAAYDAAVRAAQEKAAADAAAAGNANTGGTTGGTTGGSTGGSTGGTTGGAPLTGSWSSSAGQGQQAANFALTLMGAPYVLGGNGPGYDCSGITYAAWRSVGYTLSRTAQWQYNTTTHIPISDMRPGDLVFYGTGRSSSAIYHVAIYIGNGQVAEAATWGEPAQVRAYDASWRINNLIPYAGRP